MNSDTKPDTTTMNLPIGTTTIKVGDITSEENFNGLKLKKALLKGIYKYGWEKPSPIQEQAIPFFIREDKKDIIAQAQSGTGKTGAFLIGILQNLNLEEIGAQAILVSPTRELAIQTNDVCINLSKDLPSKSKPLCHLFVGGNDRKLDISRVKKDDIKIAIGTPGRLHDMIKNYIIKVDKIKMVILDEADDLLSQDFEKQIISIIQLLPKNIQVGLFSATLSNEVLILTNKIMKDPIRILKEKEQLSLKAISQYYIDVSTDDHDDSSIEDNKLAVLLDLYGSLSLSQSVIFCNTKRKVELLSQKLKNKDFSCTTIHSEMNKQEREQVMKGFRNGDNRILISTDIIARGIDVHHVSMVVNHDIPNSKETFLHRCGRAGRYGRKGITINFISNKDSDKIKEVEEYYSIKIEELPNNFMDVLK